LPAIAKQQLCGKRNLSTKRATSKCNGTGNGSPATSGSKRKEVRQSSEVSRFSQQA
jgi:hypothetical protein